MTIQQSIPLPPEATSAPETASATEIASRVTPMMEQYLEIKAAHPGLLLFYRMGDFYELFFEDAEIASKTLGIVLTKRGKHQGMDIPMCGVPVERSEDYLHRLIAAGHRVAGWAETEDPAAPRARGHKSGGRAGRALRGLPAPADRGGSPRRGLRADRRSGRRAGARQQERRTSRRGATGDTGHADRGHPARCPRQQLPAGNRAQPRLVEPGP